MAKTAQNQAVHAIDNALEVDPADCGCSVKLRIMDAAKERFNHYGYGKTTIADIASDCEMSAGNIYRYFDSKLDIASTILQKLSHDLIMTTRKKVEKTKRARDKFRVFLFENLRTTYHILEKNPKLAEMVTAVRQRRPEIRRWSRETERMLIADILKHGRKTGEFRLDCISSTARIIQCLVSQFRWSKLSMPYINLKRLETELEGTFEMITTALGAGCILGKIMRKHPKINSKQAQAITAQAAQTQLNQIPLPEGAVF